MDDRDAMPTNTAHGRRRRRKKKDPTSTSRSSIDVANQQDAELEREVDAYANDWDGPVGNMNVRKRQRHIGGESEEPTPSTTEAAESAENDTTMEEEAGGNISRSLPVLLHLREVGYPRRRPRHIISDGIELSGSSSRWISRMLKTVRGGDNDESATRRPAKSSARGIGEGNNCHAPLGSDDGATSCCADNTTTMSRSGSGENQLCLQQAWRPYTRREIPFSELRTPLSDA